jgi:hypothetical protein
MLRAMSHNLRLASALAIKKIVSTAALIDHESCQKLGMSLRTLLRLGSTGRRQ